VTASGQPPSIDRKSARKFLEDELRAAMAALGFAPKKFWFAKTFNDETTLLVSLQILRGAAPLLGLFPKVGFMNGRVEKLLDGLWNPDKAASGAKYRGTRYTLSAPLGYLCPDPLQNEWYFECTECAIRDAVRAVAEKVATCGMPFMTRYPDLGALLRWAKNPTLDPYAMAAPQPWLSRAAILYLNADVDGAKEVIATTIARAGEEDLSDPNFRPTLRLGALLGILRRDRH
jgi:hypothetical protein